MKAHADRTHSVTQRDFSVFESIDSRPVCVGLKPVFHSRISPPLAKNLIRCSFAPSVQSQTKLKIQPVQQLERPAFQFFIVAHSPQHT